MDSDEITGTYDAMRADWFKRLGVYNTGGIGKLASKYRNGMECDVLGMANGSFNWCFKVVFKDNVAWAVRFPVPGKVVHPEEKIRREVAVMRFIKAKTSIPVPEIIAWGTAADNHDPAMGPFLITEWVEGVRLGDFMEVQPRDHILGPMMRNDISDDVVFEIYRQMARIMLELSKHEFDSIGALEEVKDENGDSVWQVSSRPMSRKMNEIHRSGYVDMSDHGLAPFKTVPEYMHYLLDQNIKHLDKQRNSVDDAEDARAKYIRRQQLKDVVDFIVVKDHESGPFTLVCDDFRPGNILIDPKSMKITAVIDWEWTYAAPYQFLYTPPWWLILENAMFWGEDGMEKEYHVKFEVFIKALEAEEDNDASSSSASASSSSPSSTMITAQRERMSILMRRSMRDGKFWSNLILHETFEFDSEVYWRNLESCLQSTGRSIQASAGPIDERVVDDFVKRKLQELAKYKSELPPSEEQTLQDPTAAIDRMTKQGVLLGEYTPSTSQQPSDVDPEIPAPSSQEQTPAGDPKTSAPSTEGKSLNRDLEASKLPPSEEQTSNGDLELSGVSPGEEQTPMGVPEMSELQLSEERTSNGAPETSAPSAEEQTSIGDPKTSAPSNEEQISNGDPKTSELPSSEEKNPNSDQKMSASSTQGQFYSNGVPRTPELRSSEEQTLNGDQKMSASATEGQFSTGDSKTSELPLSEEQYLIGDQKMSTLSTEGQSLTGDPKTSELPTSEEQTSTSEVLPSEEPALNGDQKMSTLSTEGRFQEQTMNDDPDISELPSSEDQTSDGTPETSAVDGGTITHTE